MTKIDNTSGIMIGRHFGVAMMGMGMFLMLSYTNFLKQIAFGMESVENFTKILPSFSRKLEQIKNLKNTINTTSTNLSSSIKLIMAYLFYSGFQDYISSNYMLTINITKIQLYDLIVSSTLGLVVMFVFITWMLKNIKTTEEEAAIEVKYN